MADNFLQQGIIAFRAGKKEDARRLFIAAVKQNPNDENSWGWMYSVANNDKERIEFLKQMLRINPKNEEANKLLNELNDFEPPPVFQSIQLQEKKEVAPQIQSKPDVHQPMKKCPYCAEMVLAEAEVCRYCGQNINPQVMQAKQKMAQASLKMAEVSQLRNLSSLIGQIGCWLIALGFTLPCLIIFILSQFSN